MRWWKAAGGKRIEKLKVGARWKTPEVQMCTFWCLFVVQAQGFRRAINGERLMLNPPIQTV